MVFCPHVQEAHVGVLQRVVVWGTGVTVVQRGAVDATAANGGVRIYAATSGKITKVLENAL